MPRQFAVSFDYRCPFARNGHESVVAGLREGRDWDVRFLPFSLDQVHVEEGETPVWDRDPDAWGTGVSALLWGIAARDAFPDKFLDWHLAAFTARHDHGAKIAKTEVLAEIATSVGLDAESLIRRIAERADRGKPVARSAAPRRRANRCRSARVPRVAAGSRSTRDKRSP